MVMVHLQPFGLVRRRIVRLNWPRGTRPYRTNASFFGLSPGRGDPRGYREPLLDLAEQLGDAAPAHRGELERFAARQPLGPCLLVQEVDLVEDEEPRNFRVPELAEDPLHGRDLGLVSRMRPVHEVDEQVGVLDLLERRTEGVDQVLRQVADEPHRVVDHDLALARQPQPTRRRIERREHPVLDEDLAFRQHVEERALPRVRVADERHDRHVPLAAPRAPLLAPHALSLELLLEKADAVADAPAIDFELLLTGASAADAALEAG